MAPVQSKLTEGWRWWLDSLTNNKVLTSSSIIIIVIHNLFVWRRIVQSKRTKTVERLPARPIDEMKLDRYSNLFPTTTGRVGVNKQFFSQISALAKILFPSGWWKGDTVTFTLILHTTFLVLRTYISLVVARIDGRLVRDLVNRDGTQFIRSLGYWFAVAVPATYSNSMIRYLQSKLTIGFRTRLIDHCHELYLGKHLTYYKLLNLDRSIEGPDQYIAADIARFCDSLASLYSNLGKPILDLIIFNYQLSRSIGASGSASLMGIYVLTVSLLRRISPAFGKMAAVQTQLEGEFRGAHSRLITNAEEVAFYHGGTLEKSILNRAYVKLIKHVNAVYKVRITYNLIEDFIIKYCWSAIGLVACSVPVFKPHWISSAPPSLNEGSSSSKGRPASRTQEFITNKRLMLNLGDAGGRIMYSYKELAELAGYTHRVYNLISTLHALRRNRFSKPPPGDEVIKGELFTLDSIRGRIVFGQDCIAFENIPIVTPNPTNPGGGDLLVKDLCFDLKPGHHLLVTGPNGVGKTGIARVLRGLWPVFRGTMKRPSIEDIFFVPQKSYLTLGNFRDQIIYPHTHEDMIKAGRTDEELLEILQEVYLGYIPGREGGLETVKEWKDVLSGGEKQRVGMARLFYHKPKFAILDECTSAVSSDVEGLMYNHAKELGITLLTISHRPSLFKYHEHLLSLHGGSTGSYDLTGIASDAERHTTLAKEISSIQEKLRDVEQWKKRLEVVKKELSGGEPPKSTKTTTAPSSSKKKSSK